MFEQITEQIRKDPEKHALFKEMFEEQSISARSVLLREGEISHKMYFIKKGCLRMWFNNNGKDVTFQFFFEGQAVASIDSFMKSEPSLYTLESIEPATIFSLNKQDFDRLFQIYPEMKDGFYEIMMERFRNYAMLFLSRIKDTPQQRYQDLIKNHPEIIRRIPQHYIASYLGITPISLSRIRNRK